MRQSGGSKSVGREMFQGMDLHDLIVGCVSLCRDQDQPENRKSIRGVDRRVGAGQ
jgi:hypothetical protein